MIKFKRKCKGLECPLKESCKRFRSKSLLLTSYIQGTPFKYVGNMNQYITCDYFIKYYK